MGLIVRTNWRIPILVPMVLAGLMNAQSPVTVTPTVIAVATAGTAYSQTLTASGGTGSPYTWSAALATGGSLPAWLSIVSTNATTAVLSGTPPASGTLNITVTARDSQSNPGNKGFTLSINFVNTVITTNIPAGMAIINISGTSSTATVGGDGAGASGGTNQSLWYQPFNTASQLLQYTIPNGTYTLRVINPADAASIFPNLTQAQLSSMWTAWTFNSPWLTDYLVFDSSATSNSSQSQLFSGAGGSPGTGDAASAYADALNGYTNGNNVVFPPYFNSIFVGNRAAAPQKTVTFPFVGNGPENLIFAVPDSDLTDNHGGISVLIAPATSAPAISTTTLSGGQVNVAYTATMAATGGSGIYTWSAAPAGVLPAGLSVSSGGVLSGTPTFTASYQNVQITVTDPVSGLFATKTFTVNIAPPTPPLTLNTTSIPHGIGGASYSAPLSATGGFGGYSWNLSGSTPLLINSDNGTLGSDGTLSPGSYGPFTVTVSDTAGDSSSQTYTLIVDAGISFTPSAGTLSTGQTGQVYSFQLVAAGGSGNYSWSLPEGSPSSFNLAFSPNATGQRVTLSGTPTQSDTDAGFDIFVLLTDTSTNATLQQRYTIPVTQSVLPNGNQPPGTTIFVLNEDGSLVSLVGGSGRNIVPGNECVSCFDMARDAAGNFLVAGGNFLYGYTPAGGLLFQPVPALPATDSTVASFYESVAVDSAGNYIIVDTANHRVLKFSQGSLSTPLFVVPYPAVPSFGEDAYIRVDSSGNYILAEDNSPDQDLLSLFLIAPTGGSPVPIPITPAGQSSVPSTTGGFTFDANGNYVNVDWNNDVIYTITRYGAPGAGTSTQLYTDTHGYLSDPEGIYRDPGTGSFFLVDDENNALYSFAADGGNFTQIASSQLFASGPSSLVVVDTVPYVLQRDLTIVSTNTGSTVSCSVDVCGETRGYDLALDTSNNFVVATGDAIVKITQAGVSSVIASGTSETGAGPSPLWVSVAVDSAGNFIVADNVRHQLVRISPAGAISPTVFPYLSSDRSPGEDVFVRIDGQGNYIVAEDNGTDGAGPLQIHKITPAGVVTTLTLTGTVPNVIGGLVIDAAGRYLVSDTRNDQLDLFTQAGAGSVFFNNTDQIDIAAGMYLDKASGNLLVVDQEDDNLDVLSPDGAQATQIASQLSSPVAVVSISPVAIPALAITTSVLPGGTQGQTYSPVTLAASGGVAPYSWSATGLPGGMSLSTAGLLSGVPGSPGTFPVQVTVADSAQRSVSASLSLTISPAFQPPPPPSLSITTLALPNGTVGTSYGPAGVSATGGSGNYSWSVSGAPGGIGISGTGILSGTPTAAGTFAVTVSVTSGNQSAQQTFTINIAFGSLTLNGPSSLGGSVPGAAVSANYTASGGSPPYAFSAGGLPTGLVISSTSGKLTGSIAQPGNYNFTIQVKDSQPVTTSINVSAFVLGIATSSLPDASNQIPYSQTLTAIGGAAPYSWAVNGTLPAGLTLSGSGVLTGTPVLTGAPAATQTFSFSVAVTSNGVTASKTLSLNVTLQPQPLTIPGGGGANPISLPSGQVQVGYSQALQAAGGIPPYSWQILAGAPPDGISLASSGTVSGTPSKVGSFGFTAQVRDSSGGSAAAGFLISISPSGLTITTNSPLPNAIVGTSYPPQTFTASGGIEPYTFLVQGGLPAGLTFLNGEISGAPTTAGASSFTVNVTDSSPSALTASSQFSIPVAGPHTDLILSQTAFSFSFFAGAPALPSGPSSAVVTVGSNSTQALGFSVAVSPAVSWLDVSGGGQTPDTIAISLDPKALALSAGPQKTSIIVTCVTPALASQPSPCAGTSQTISVALNVISAPPQIVAGPAAISFSAQTGSPLSQSQSLILQNAGGGNLTINSVTSPDSFVTLGGVPASIPASGSVVVAVTVNSAGLAAGFHRSSILVNTSAGSAIVSVSLLIAQNSVMALNPAGTQFQMPVGSSPGKPNGSFEVSTTSKSAVSWSAAVLPGAAWLQLAGSNFTSSSASPGTVNFSINPSVAATLTAQAYYGTIRVTSANFVNSPQDFVVVLNVVTAASLLQPDPEPAGLIFIAKPTSALPSQTVQVYSGSSLPVTYSAASDSSWLSVAVGSGTASAGSPDTSRISVNTTGLAAGVYHGGVSYQFTAPGASTAVRTVNVTLLVEAGAAPAARTGFLPLQAAACAPTQLVPTQTGLVDAFAQPASWPTPLNVLLMDDCGQPVTSGQVVVTFSNGDPPLALSAADSVSGNYAATWTPRRTSSQITISARAAAAGFAPAIVQIAGQVTPNAAPILDPNGTLNAFAPVVGAPVAPGTIVQIYGVHLAGQIGAATAIPLPTKLNSTSVLIGGQLAPLYYVSPGQINAQVPFELIGGNQYQVIVNANGVLSTPNPIQLSASAPGIAGFATGQIIAQHLDGSLVLESAPAAPGEIIVFYVSGMGLTNQAITSGSASPSTNLASPLDPPTLTLGDIPIAATDILFSGLTPTLVGLYQIDFRIPAAAPNGDLQLVLTQSDGSGNTTVLPVHN